MARVGVPGTGPGVNLTLQAVGLLWSSWAGWELRGRAELLLGGCVYLTVESRTEPLVFPRGCCRSLKCAIGTEVVKEHLFLDESPYLGVHSYFLTINSTQT